MFGLMDPGRAASIAALPPATSHTQSSYTKPARDSYQPVRTVDPFRHTADFAWNEKWSAADQHSEQRASYQPMPASVYEARALSTKQRPSELSLT